jgi:SAM-dependent methyltransferase
MYNGTLRDQDEIIDAVERLRKLGLRPHDHEMAKNWDLCRAVEFVTQTLPQEAPILDAGARWSPFLARLEQLGYSDLWACDLKLSWRERFKRLIQKSGVRFVQCDLTRTPFSDGSFTAIACLSVIEHGVDLQRYAAEMARLLRPGGYLLTSTDFWATPIDCRGIFPYGAEFGEMHVFTPEELNDFVGTAERYSLRPIEPLDLQCAEPVVTWERVDRSYTFTFFVMRKTPA